MVVQYDYLLFHQENFGWSELLCATFLYRINQVSLCYLMTMGERGRNSNGSLGLSSLKTKMKLSGSEKAEDF